MKEILIIDDNKDNTDLAKLVLESSGYSCTTVNGGIEGLEQLRKKRFDLTFLDLAMPQVGGIDVLQKLREENLLSTTRIVLFTASPEFSDVEVERLKNEYNVSDRIRKPFSKKELLDVVTKNLA